MPSHIKYISSYSGYGFINTVLIYSYTLSILLFFFQAEDGIRDGHVTGVQTCALPIYGDFGYEIPMTRLFYKPEEMPSLEARSEERRVGKEGRCGGSQEGRSKEGHDERRHNRKDGRSA